MEQIVYCQDQVYRGALQKVREKEAEEEKNRKSNQYFLSPAPSSDPSIAEIFQHLIAYHQVSLRVSERWSLSPLSSVSAFLFGRVAAVR